jgi:hypothetical protein
MEELEWSADQKAAAQAAVVERFQRNSVGDRFIPALDVEWSETVVPWNRFDFQERRTVDQETLSLHEPYAIVELTRAQADEPSLTRALSTIHRAASALARWHDVLLFTGFEDGKKLKPRGVEMPQPKKIGAPVSLREAAMQAEKEEGSSPIPVRRRARRSTKAWSRRCTRPC